MKKNIKMDIKNYCTIILPTNEEFNAKLEFNPMSKTKELMWVPSEVFINGDWISIKEFDRVYGKERSIINYREHLKS